MGSSLSDDPLGSPESYLKFDVKKGASLDPNYEAVSTSSGLENIIKETNPGWLLERISIGMDKDKSGHTASEAFPL